MLVLDHYLEVLTFKPGALPGATALVQARATGSFTSAHEAFWAAARKAHGDGGGTRALIEVLLLHRHMPPRRCRCRDHRRAVRSGADQRRCRRCRGPQTPGAERGRPNRSTTVTVSEPEQRVVSLTERRSADPEAVIAGLPRIRGRCRRSPPTTSCSVDAVGTGHHRARDRSEGERPCQPLRRRRGMTEQAAAAAIDQACRLLRLPTIRGRFAEIAAAAEQEQLTYRGSWPSCCWPNATTGTDAAPSAGSRPPGSPGTSGCRTSTSTPTRTSTRPRSTPSPAAAGSATASRCA